MTGKNRRMFNFFLKLLCCIVLAGCASDSFQLSVDTAPLTEIQKTLSDELPQGVGFVSQNRRDFYSKVFTQTGIKSKVDLVMLASIVGDRRPYKVLFSVRQVNGSAGNSYDRYSSGQDFRGAQSLSKRIAAKVEASLNKRQKEKNLFDDFRAF